MRITASAVSRRLGRKFVRSQWLASGRVRGWGHWTEGFQVEQVGEHVAVYYNGGDWAPRDPAQKAAQGRKQMDKYIAYLIEHGYTVSSYVNGAHHNEWRVEVAK